MTTNRSDKNRPSDALEREFAKKLTGYLDLSTDDIKAGTAYRLQQSRAAVLARLADSGARTATAPRLAPALAGIGGGAGSGNAGNRSFLGNSRLWVGVLLIALMGVGYHQWKTYQQVRELTELDTQILTSELPIDAYLDRGFQAWLTSNEEE